MAAPMNRRKFLGLTATATVGLTAAACAGSGGSGSGGASGGANSLGALQFWSNHPGTSKATEQELISAYTAANPDAKVTLVDGGKDYEALGQKFTVALQSRSNIPDVIVASDTTWFNFALNKRITPLDDLFGEAGLELSDYVDSLASDYLFEGKHYAIPYARSTPLFYYNKDVWAKAGLPDRGPDSWDEFAQWAPKLSETVGADKKAITISDGSNYTDWYYQGLNWSKGAAYSDDWKLLFTEPASIAAGQFFKDLIVRHGSLAPKPANNFGAGLTAATLESTGQLNAIAKSSAGKFEVGTAFLPGPRGNSCPTGGAGLAIPADISDERKKAALKFIKFYTSTPSTITFTQATGYMPVTKAAATDPKTTAFVAQKPNYGTAVAQVPFTKPQDYARVFVPGGAVAIGDALTKIGNGADPAVEFAALQRKIQTVIDTQITPKLPK